jgi:hypothetical protein
LTYLADFIEGAGHRNIGNDGKVEHIGRVCAPEFLPFSSGRTVVRTEWPLFKQIDHMSGNGARTTCTLSVKGDVRSMEAVWNYP